MKKILFLFYFLLLAGCSPIQLETSYVPVKQSEWTVGYAYDDGFFGEGTITELVKNGERIDSWTQLLTIQFYEGIDTEIELFYQTYRYALSKRVKESTKCQYTQWHLIEKRKTSVIYEWRAKDCHREADQHEIAKLMKGNDGIHRVAYVKKNEDINFKERNKWIDVLQNSYIEKAGEKVIIEQ